MLKKKTQQGGVSEEENHENTISKNTTFVENTNKIVPKDRDLFSVQLKYNDYNIPSTHSFKSLESMKKQKPALERKKDSDNIFLRIDYNVDKEGKWYERYVYEKEMKIIKGNYRLEINMHVWDSCEKTDEKVVIDIDFDIEKDF